LGENLWPWESQRWTELVFCVFSASTGPEVAPEAVREATHLLEKGHLIDIQVLGGLDPSGGGKDAAHPTLAAMQVILKNYGFSEEEIHLAVSVLCRLAAGMKAKFDGKVQKCLRKYGMAMLKEIERDFAVPASDGEPAQRAIALWLQNVLNLPLAVPDEISEKACALLQTDYPTLIRAADEIDVNVALLDNVLRSYWQQEIEIGQD
jgi:hypothetical protein